MPISIENCEKDLKDIQYMLFHYKDKAVAEKGYSHYNNFMQNKTEEILNNYANILGYKNNNGELIGYAEYMDELMQSLQTTRLITGQEIQIRRLKTNPIVIKILGERALEEKEEIEQLIGEEITCEGQSCVKHKVSSTLQISNFANQTAPTRTIKSVKILDAENEMYRNKLEDSLSLEQAESYSRSLNNIYNYYRSLSKAEQVPYTEISNDEQTSFEELGKINNLNGDELFKGDNKSPQQYLEEAIVIKSTIEAQAQENNTTADSKMFSIANGQFLRRQDYLYKEFSTEIPRPQIETNIFQEEVTL